MKNFFMKIVFLTAAVVIVLTFAACEKNPDDVTQSESYSYQTIQNTTAENVSNDPNQPFLINSSWQDNYCATYEYYNAEDGDSSVRIRETKNSSEFAAEYLDGGSALYYKANGKDTDYYVLVTGKEKTAVHSLLENTPFSELSSTYMKLTKVSENLPSLSNVLYMYDENVGGRACHKYIQRAYSGGELTESVYVWVDVEYGFALRCEAYGADGNLKIMWRTDSFETGSVDEGGIGIDISSFSVSEETSQ